MLEQITNDTDGDTPTRVQLYDSFRLVSYCFSFLLLPLYLFPSFIFMYSDIFIFFRISSVCFFLPVFLTSFLPRFLFLPFASLPFFPLLSSFMSLFLQFALRPTQLCSFLFSLHFLLTIFRIFFFIFFLLHSILSFRKFILSFLSYFSISPLIPLILFSLHPQHLYHSHQVHYSRTVAKDDLSAAHHDGRICM